MIDLPKDQTRTAQLRPFLDHFNNLVAGLDVHSSAEKRRAVEELLWMIEEYKVSVFAQELGKSLPVYEKRLRHIAGEIDRMI